MIAPRIYFRVRTLSVISAGFFFFFVVNSYSAAVNLSLPHLASATILRSKVYQSCSYSCSSNTLTLSSGIQSNNSEGLYENGLYWHNASASYPVASCSGLSSSYVNNVGFSGTCRNPNNDNDPNTMFDVASGSKTNSDISVYSNCASGLFLYGVNIYATCDFTFTFDCDLEANSAVCGLPRCDKAHSVAADFCKGGVGQQYIGSFEKLYGETFYQLYGSGDYDCSQYSYCTGWFDNSPAEYRVYSMNAPANDTLTRPDGSVCNAFNIGIPYNFIMCPLGFVDQSSSSAAESSSSSAAESSSSFDKCANFPFLPECESSGGSSGSGGDGGGSGGDGGGSAGSGAGCSDLSNCDWAKLNVQLEQLGVDVEIRNKIGDIVGLLNNGYNLSNEQLGELQGLRDDLGKVVGSASSGIIGAIDRLGDGLGDGISDVVKIIDSLKNGLNRGVAEGVEEGVKKLLSDTASISSGMESNRSSAQASVDSLDDNIDWMSAKQASERIRQKVDSSAFTNFESFSLQFADSINLYIAPLTSYLSGFEPRTAIDLSFDTEVMGIGCFDCKIDFTDIFGFNAISFFNNLLVLAASVTGFIMVFRTIRTGGNS